MLVCARLRLLRLSREFEERLRLVSANREINAFDDDDYPAVGFDPEPSMPTSEPMSKANGRKKVKVSPRLAAGSEGDDDGL